MSSDVSVCTASDSSAHGESVRMFSSCILPTMSLVRYAADSTAASVSGSSAVAPFLDAQ